MSNVKLQASASGTGTVTIAPPVTNSDLTINLPANSGTVPTIASVVNNGVVYTNSTGAITSSSALTFDGTNLGVLGGSVTSPAAKIHAVGNVRSSNGAGTIYTQLSSDGVYSTGTDLYLLAPTGYSNIFYTNNTERMRLDSSGNLGLGVTPSAWGSNNQNLEGPYGAIALGTGLGTALTANAYYSGSGWRYKGNGTAKALVIDSNSWQFYNASSGTTGNTISFTQAMTLDASGNLGIGTSSPDARLTIASAGRGRWYRSDNTRFGDVFMDSDGFNVVAQSAGDNLTLGSLNVITFRTASSERARIDSSGRFAVGMTNFTGSAGDGTGFGASPIGYIQVIRNQNPCAFLGRTVSTGNVVTLAYGSSNTNAGEVGSISVTASSTAYNTSSDYRLKENIQPMTGALAKVAVLKPCTYKWKVDGSDGEGFIAHELAEVVPQAVNGEKDAVDADGNPVYQGIDTSFLVATLTAAIQELNAKVESLTTELNALKGT